MPLTYHQVQGFRDKTRFWSKNLAENLYIFDQHINHLYELSDAAKDLILASSETDFRTIMAALDDDEKRVNTEFLNDILQIPAEEVMLLLDA